MPVGTRVSIAVRGGELWSREIQGEGEIGVLHSRTAQVRAEQVRPREVASSEIGADEQCVPQVGAAQPVAPQIGSGEVGARDEIGIDSLVVREVRTPHLRTDLHEDRPNGCTYLADLEGLEFVHAPASQDGKGFDELPRVVRELRIVGALLGLEQVPHHLVQLFHHGERREHPVAGVGSVPPTHAGGQPLGDGLSRTETVEHRTSAEATGRQRLMDGAREACVEMPARRTGGLVLGEVRRPRESESRATQCEATAAVAPEVGSMNGR